MIAKEEEIRNIVKRGGGCNYTIFREKLYGEFYES